jgi:hypothetical protein
MNSMVGVIGWMAAGWVLIAGTAFLAELYVACDGSDAYPGTKSKPLATIARARDAVRLVGNAKPVTVYLRSGTYELTKPVVFTPRDSGTKQAPVTYCAYPGEQVIISGGRRLRLQWRPWRNGIMQARVDSAAPIDQLFVNGTRQHIARWPNPEPWHKAYSRGLKPVKGEPVSKVTPPLRGYPALVFDPAKFSQKKWAHPELAVIHVMQQQRWGNMQWKIRSIDYKTHTITLGEGGWQIGTLWEEFRVNRVGGHSQFFVENVLEELDAPGEYFHDVKGGVLYVKPAGGVSLDQAEVAACGIKQLIQFTGEVDEPVKHITIRGIAFKHTARTFLDVYETRLRGDWAITRQAAVKVEGAEDCTLSDCTFTGLGGNAVFLSHYNRRVTVSDSVFSDIGDSAVAIVGSDDAVRSLKVHRKRHVPLTEIDTAIGPRTQDYPGDCRVHNNLMYDLGIFGKQVAGVYLSACQGITVSHNTICRVPRAAICINDGCWGGHIIEFNDVSMTVLETGDHGPFNAWGRDRYWQTGHRAGGPYDMTLSKKYAKLDNHLPTIIRNNRFAERFSDPRLWVRNSDPRWRRGMDKLKYYGSHSWGIDLDDGAANYRVYNNLCLGCSIKLREGYYRTVENNVFIGPHPPERHMGFQDSSDVYRRNIYVNTRDGQAWSRHWGTRDLSIRIDYNLYFNYSGDKPVFGIGTIPNVRSHGLTLEQWRAKGKDKHSAFADPIFVDPAKGDYRVKAGSPALKLGFRNFPMDKFGTQKEEFQPVIREVTKIE